MQQSHAGSSIAGSRSAQVEQPALVVQVNGVMKSLEELKGLTSSLEAAADRLRMEPQDTAASGMPPQPDGGSLENRMNRIQNELNALSARLMHVAHRFDKAV